MSRLSAVARLRLHETLSAVADALPDELRAEFFRACWHWVSDLDDTSASIERRARIRRAVPELWLDDWRRVLDLLQHDGASPVLDRWGRDTGLYRPVLSTSGKDDR